MERFRGTEVIVTHRARPLAFFGGRLLGGVIKRTSGAD